MKRTEVKENIGVIDRCYPELGPGRITNVKKTIFTVVFVNKEVIYDYPHAQFLELIK